jgi:AmmeMemoRadiSam system protein B
MDTLPPLRADIDLIPANIGGRELIVVRDPLGIVRPDTALLPELVPYLPLFNGTLTIGDLRVVMMRRRGGTLVFLAEAEDLVKDLDQLGLLQTQAYREASEKIAREFAQKSSRPAALAGNAYPSDPGELAALLDRILALPGSVPPTEDIPGTPCALAAPHIDLRVAEKTYGVAYRSMRHVNPTAVLLLGTGHALAGNRYSVSAKTFETPLGRVLSDIEAAARLREAAPEALAADDFAHRSEHSLEFQLLFLQRIFPMEKVPILPVLCGPMEDLFARVGSPLEVPAIDAFVAALRDWLASPPVGKFVVAGIDLSHVGPKFGDPEPARALEPAFRAFDKELLDALTEGDSQKFFATGAKTGNRFRVCGFSALWTLLALVPGVRGTTLDYGVWHEEPTRSAVSFTATAFHR